MALAGAALMRLIPPSRPSVSCAYPRLMRSLLRLWREQPRLRRASWVQGMLFAAFSAFWTTLALHLEQPPFHMGADVAGLFGVIGAMGVLAAPVAGRVADREGPRARGGHGRLGGAGRLAPDRPVEQSPGHGPGGHPAGLRRPVLPHRPPAAGLRPQRPGAEPPEHPLHDLHVPGGAAWAPADRCWPGGCSGGAAWRHSRWG